MKSTFAAVTFSILFLACNTKSDKTENVHKISHPKKTETKKRLSYKEVTELSESNSAWMKVQDSVTSLALNFRYKDTLTAFYSPECCLILPYKFKNGKVVVYWDKNLDTKYDFDIVKAVNKTSDKYIGKPFMILELVNDTTLKATYPIENLIHEINASGKNRTFFTPEYVVNQDGFF